MHQFAKVPPVAGESSSLSAPFGLVPFSRGQAGWGSLCPGKL